MKLHLTLKNSWWLMWQSSWLILSYLLLFLESGRHLPDDVKPRSPVHFTNIVPVSASTGFGLSVLKSFIRQSLEEQDVIQTESQRSERLLKLRRQISTPSLPSWGNPHVVWDPTYRSLNLYKESLEVLLWTFVY